jgi:hypothetical protein
MSGTINLSLSQQLDEYGQPLSGGKLYIIQAGTVATPQNAYQDTALTIALPNPITLDAAGRIPQFFLADGQIKVRLQDKLGVVKFTADNLLVIGPSGGSGGGGGTVDATTVLQTGDIKVRYDTAIIAGFVRCNGKTIGSSSSGATELADPSTQALFLHLWNKDTSLVVSGGRGASASADWTANKQIALPDARGRGIVALADMGNSDVGYFSGVPFSKGNQTTLGSLGGIINSNIILGTANLPPYTPGGSISVTIDNVSMHYPCRNYFNGSGATVAEVQLGANTAPSGGTISATFDSGTAHGSFAGSAQGGSSAPFNVTTPFMLFTIYMKL